MCLATLTLWRCRSHLAKAKSPTFLRSHLVMLLKQQVAWALGEKGQAHQLDHSGDGNCSKQIRPGALLQGEEGSSEWMWPPVIAWGLAPGHAASVLQKVPLHQCDPHQQREGQGSLFSTSPTSQEFSKRS